MYQAQFNCHLQITLDTHSTVYFGYRHTSWIIDHWRWDREVSRNVGKELPLLAP